MKFEVVSEIQASLNSIDSEKGFKHNNEKMLKQYRAIERLREVEPHWFLEVRVKSAKESNTKPRNFSGGSPSIPYESKGYGSRVFKNINNDFSKFCIKLKAFLI